MFELFYNRINYCKNSIYVPFFSFRCISKNSRFNEKIPRSRHLIKQSRNPLYVTKQSCSTDNEVAFRGMSKKKIRKTSILPTSPTRSLSRFSNLELVTGGKRAFSLEHGDLSANFGSGNSDGWKLSVVIYSLSAG